MIISLGREGEKIMHRGIFFVGSAAISAGFTALLISIHRQAPPIRQSLSWVFKISPFGRDDK